MKFGLYIRVSIMLLLFPTFNLAWAQDYAPESLLVTLFADGKAEIEYRLSTDVTVPTISVPLFGTILEQLIVVDDENRLVDHRIEGNSLVIDTFGASGVLITYTTSDLVNKTGRLWTFSIDSPVDISIKLPGDSTIIGLNQVFISLKQSENQYLLVMATGHTEVSYVIGVLGTKEHANAAISDAENIISDLKTDGIIVSEAESKLTDARDAFESAKYGDAEKLANEARTLANRANQTSVEVNSVMNDVEADIEEAGRQGISITEAQQLLNKARLEYDIGNYEESLTLAEQARDVVQDALNSEPPYQQNQTYLFAGMIAAAAGGAGVAMYMRSRKRSVAAEQLEHIEHVIKEKRIIDLNKIFTEKPYLRQEDKDTVNYLAEKGGEAFESEIRERFQLPKTTVWRLVKRLEREDLVEVKKAGGQNLIRIREEFTRVDQQSPQGSGK
jgi:uncharacterized membrane protein